MNPHGKLFTLYPLFQLAIALSAGIYSAHSRLRLSLAACAFCSIASLAFLLIRKLNAAGALLLMAFFFGGSSLTTDLNDLRRIVEQRNDEVFTVTGVLDGPPEFARDRLYISLRVEVPGAGRVSLLAPFRNDVQEYRALQLRYGDRVRVTTTLERIGNYRNPGVSSLTDYLDRHGFDASGLVRGPGSIELLDHAGGLPLLGRLYDWRDRLQREIDARFAPETAGVLDAALLGNRYNLSPSTSERFREGGTFHVLVISGLHISFVGGLVLLLVRRLSRSMLLQFVVPAVVVWAYSIAVGAEASVVRAALMFTFAALGPIIFREPTSLNGLGAAALVLLVQSPQALFDPSFQLTFLSVLAIVVIAWPLLLKLSAIGSWYPTSATPHPPVCSRGLKSFCELLFWSERDWRREVGRSTHKYRLFKTSAAAWLERYHLQRCLRYLFGAVLVSGCVQLVLLPLMIVYFHRLSLASLLLNIVVSVLLAVLVAVAALAILIAQVSTTLATPLLKCADALNWLMVHSVDPFSGAGSFRLPEYTGAAAAVYAVYYLPLLLFVLALWNWRPLALLKDRHYRLHRFVVPVSALQIALVAVLILHPFSADRANGKLRVDFLDVGQGDSALITMPDGATLLVDGGGSINNATRRIGETVVSEYLWWRGLSQIDYVLVTHADADHIDGLNDVLENFYGRSALIARSPADDPEFAKFSATAANTRTQVVTLQAGDTIYFGDVAVEVLWPPAGGESSANNDSIVLRLKFGERSILLTGDIEKAAERSLIESGQELWADVVKVPHHGSKSSSTDAFVLATRPTFAIVSVGRKSIFGHPHAEVVQRWQANGATLVTTGECGTITVNTDGHDLSLKKFIQLQNGTKDTK